MNHTFFFFFFVCVTEGSRTLRFLFLKLNVITMTTNVRVASFLGLDEISYRTRVLDLFGVVFIPKENYKLFEFLKDSYMTM